MSGRLCTSRLYKQLDLLAHRHVHFSTDVTNSTNGSISSSISRTASGASKAAFICRPCCQRNRFSFMRQMLPDLFLDKRHERMNQAHGLIQHISKNRLCLLLRRRICHHISDSLAELDVPIAQIIPDEIIQAHGLFPRIHTLSIRRVISRDSFIQAMQNPTIRCSKLAAKINISMR